MQRTWSACPLPLVNELESEEPGFWDGDLSLMPNRLVNGVGRAVADGLDDLVGVRGAVTTGGQVEREVGLVKGGGGAGEGRVVEWARAPVAISGSAGMAGDVKEGGRRRRMDVWLLLGVVRSLDDDAACDCDEAHRGDRRQPHDEDGSLTGSLSLSNMA